MFIHVHGTKGESSRAPVCNNFKIESDSDTDFQMPSPVREVQATAHESMIQRYYYYYYYDNTSVIHVIRYYHCMKIVSDIAYD